MVEEGSGEERHQQRPRKDSIGSRRGLGTLQCGRCPHMSTVDICRAQRECDLREEGGLIRCRQLLKEKPSQVLWIQPKGERNMDLARMDVEIWRSLNAMTPWRVCVCVCWSYRSGSTMRRRRCSRGWRGAVAVLSVRERMGVWSPIGEVWRSSARKGEQTRKAWVENLEIALGVERCLQACA